MPSDLFKNRDKNSIYSITRLKLSRLQIEHFKNHESADFEFGEQFNFITGGNGLGKTNLLDAIHYACSGRSFFGRSDSYAIQFKQDFAFIKALVDRENTEKEEEVKVSISTNGPAKKQIHVDGGKRNKLSDHYGYVPVVMFTPAEIKLVNEGSRERRRFLDRIMSQSDPDFLRDIIEYGKLVDSRNELLSLFRERGNFDEIALQAYDERLIPVMDRIHHARSKFIGVFSGMVETSYAALTDKKEQISLSYVSDLTETSAEVLLSSNLRNDQYAARTTAGIHKDDLELNLNGHLIRAIGSQGQVKTTVIALHLAAFQFLKDELHVLPLLLLDDIFEKIDEQRAGELLDIIGREKYGQVFITDTDESRVERHMSRSKADKKIFKFEPPQK